MGELNGIASQARCYMALGDFKHTLELVKHGKELVVGAGIQGGDNESVLTNVEADTYQFKTEYAEARHILEAILKQTSAALSPVIHAYALVNIVSLDFMIGNCTDIVSQNLQTAAAAFKHAHYPRGISLCEVLYADERRHKGDTRGARAEYMRAFADAYGPDGEIACYCLIRLADSSVNSGPEDFEDIERWATVFLAFAMRAASRSMLTVHQALRCLGDVLVQRGMSNEALSILTVALEGFTWMDVHQSRAECMRTMGQVHFGRGELSKARTLWKEARPLFERSLQTKAVANIDHRWRSWKNVMKQTGNKVLTSLYLCSFWLSKRLQCIKREKFEADVGKNTAQAVGL
ncbi:hypothetical protein B0H14DRAFT_473839 [Mycena olivaceomarginata]|nr:hypothetical protein B0H14DRAFT_473839 [Mycena olivaceomarginata]